MCIHSLLFTHRTELVINCRSHTIQLYKQVNNLICCLYHHFVFLDISFQVVVLKKNFLLSKCFRSFTHDWIIRLLFVIPPLYYHTNSLTTSTIVLSHQFSDDIHHRTVTQILWRHPPSYCHTNSLTTSTIVLSHKYSDDIHHRTVTPILWRHPPSYCHTNSLTTSTIVLSHQFSDNIHHRTVTPILWRHPPSYCHTNSLMTSTIVLSHQFSDDIHHCTVTPILWRHPPSYCHTNSLMTSTIVLSHQFSDDIHHCTVTPILWRHPPSYCHTNSLTTSTIVLSHQFSDDIHHRTVTPILWRHPPSYCHTNSLTTSTATDNKNDEVLVPLMTITTGVDVLPVCSSFLALPDRTCKVWDLGTGRELQVLAGHLSTVLLVKHCTYTHCTFTVSQSSIRIWDLRANPATCVRTLRFVTSRPVLFVSDAFQRCRRQLVPKIEAPIVEDEALFL